MSQAKNLAKLAQNITSQGILSSAAVQGGGGGGGGVDGPKITSIIVTDNSYTNLDDTAVALGGGYIKIIGSGFATGCSVLIGNVPASSTSFVSSTEVRAQVPATAAGTYIVYLVNTDGGTAIRVNAITFSSTPTWVTSSEISGTGGTPISVQLDATGATTFALQIGSTLPNGLTLTSGGLLSGTVNTESDTVYSVTVIATDNELQDSPRTFALNITSARDPYFKYAALLLPGASTTFVDDASTNNFAVTVAGDTKPNNFNPYTPGYYSNYFDGTGDYLSVPSTTALQFGTGDFTVESWVYLTATPSAQYAQIIGRTEYGTNADWMLQITNANKLTFYMRTSFVATSTAAIALNTWTHVAVSRSGSSIKLFINGAVDGTATNSGSTEDTGSGVYTIGADQAGDEALLTGYLSNLRLVKGTALYTSNFTPSTTPLTAISNTSLLTCQSNRFIDNSTNNLTITRSGDTTVNSFTPFTPNSSYSTYGSAYFDGTGDSISAPDNTAFNMTGTSYCFEAWIYPTSTAEMSIFNRCSGLGTPGLSIQKLSNGQIVFSTNDNYSTSSGTTVLANTWSHIACTYDGTTKRVFLNGALMGSTSGAWSEVATAMTIGDRPSDSRHFYMVGYISDARIVKGSAVYTTAFTPPTTPLTAISGTSLLTLQNNQSVNNSTFLDNGTNNFLVTRNGNATQGTFSPYGGNWSNYFDGTGDYLSIADNTIFEISSNQNFTIECFFNISAIPGTGAAGSIIAKGAAGIYQPYTIRVNASGNCVYKASSTGSSWDIANDVVFGAISVNTWYHVAVSRQGTNTRLFLNGTLVNTITSSGAALTDNTRAFTVGARGDATEPFFGYISNVRMLKGTALYTENFTPSTTPLTPVTGTSLLTCADNRLIDNSINNLAITRNGDVSVQRFNPFNLASVTPTSYSGYFDNTGDYLTAPANTALAMGSGAFTMEAWVYNVGGFSTDPIFESRSSAPSASGYAFLINSSGYLNVYTNSAFVGQSSTALVSGSWYHVALVRTGTGSNQTTYYINGVASGTITLSGDFTDASTVVTTIGGSTSAGENFGGYISNARIVKGTAVYTSNFTPSTTPLTAISGTQLLTCQSPTFVDNSTNAFTITAVGNSQPTQQNPFGYTSTTTQGYTVSTIGGSGYFDGTGDYLTVPRSTLCIPGASQNFTIEAWVYSERAAGVTSQQIMGFHASGVSADWIVLINSSNYPEFYISATNTTITSSISVNPYSWNHIAVVRKNTNSITIYVNGVAGVTATSASTLVGNGANPLSIGSDYNGANVVTKGYITDARVVNGTALYTSNFVPSLTPLTAVQNTVLLNNMAGAGVYDATMINNMESVGDAKLNTAVSKFGGTSMYFDGTGDYLVCPDSPNQEFGAGNLTWEMWINTTNSTQYATLYSRTPAAFTTGMWSLMMNMASATTGDVGLYVGDYSNASPLLQTTGVSIRDGNWHHIAVVRNGTAWALYVDGTSRATATWSGTIADIAYGAYISADQYYGRAFTGYIDDLRITKGVARYTSNFTPPTSAFSMY